ncbi:helix-turn-helix domain-containing protein [Streptomyces sp. B6B3]|uniref:TetR/AcrR family transcriptional regulator n=1 Tax=Streptomyces sp. B6B3 TaxID=3153570 RepID=UPI00325E4168
MGHREQLLRGARRCLEERGYARTTSRDLAAAADAPLGTINYHYGSKEGLLNAALLEAIREWGDRMLPSGTAQDAEGGLAERLQAMWSQMRESVAAERPMFVASVEAFAQAERAPEVRRQIADALEEARPRLAATLHGTEQDGTDLGTDLGDGLGDEETRRAVGSVYSALVAGLTQQWLVDPERAPDSRQVVAGLRAIARTLEQDSADSERSAPSAPSAG